MTVTSTPRILIASLCLVACAADDDADDNADASADSSSGAADSSSSAASLSEASTGPSDPSAEEGSSSGVDEGSSTTEDPFAGCDRGILEPDLIGQDAMGNPAPVAWTGPGADPETGELVDDGNTYVVSSTYLALMPDPAAQQAFGETMGPVIPTLFGNPGMIATSLGTSMECSTARTLTVWASQEAMMAFVTSDAHANAIARVAEISRGDSLVTHWTGAAIPEITWDEALARVLADEGPFY